MEDVVQNQIRIYLGKMEARKKQFQKNQLNL
jgi:hypothetical protein